MITAIITIGVVIISWLAYRYIKHVVHFEAGAPDRPWPLPGRR
jgi:hypothetical protein